MEFFIEATGVPAEDSIRFPALVLEPSKVFVPSYVCVNLGADQKTVQVGTTAFFITYLLFILHMSSRNFIEYIKNCNNGCLCVSFVGDKCVCTMFKRNLQTNSLLGVYI